MAELRLDREDEENTPTVKIEEREPTIVNQNLFKSRTILVFGQIDEKVARSVTAQLFALANDSDDPIKLVINSPGGHVESADTIFDVIRFVKPPVKMIGTGWVASAGALIFVAAKKENRFALPHTRFMLHQPSGGVLGQASDIAIEAAEIIKMRKRINETFALETGQPLEKIENDTDRNFWMSSEEAVNYGVASRVINQITEIE
jgi:ATP-dependent Clp protease protease subunit